MTREVKACRTVRRRKTSKGENASARCARSQSCQASGTACKRCSSALTTCKRCKTHPCVLTCPDFELKMYPIVQK